jgi:hypothetical protein
MQVEMVLDACVRLLAHRAQESMSLLKHEHLSFHTATKRDMGKGKDKDTDAPLSNVMCC